MTTTSSGAVAGASGKSVETKLYTIGHSTHPTERFVRLLKENGVTAVCDVRSTPYSRFNPQFNRETIRTELDRNGVAYVFLGQELGARSEDPACYRDDKVQFDVLANQQSFRDGLERLRQGMQDYVVALMCAEKDPITCHRMILVCRALGSDALSILHIDDTGKAEPNASAEKRLMRALGTEPDMFHDEAACIEEAYERQSRKIAYVRKSRSSA